MTGSEAWSAGAARNSPVEVRDAAAVLDGDWCTAEALRRLPPLRKPPVIMALGSGAGRQTILLASRFRAPVDALDSSPEALHDLSEAAAAAGVAEWVKPRLDSLDHRLDESRRYDLIWCDRAVDRLGLRRSLELWRPLLYQRGILAVGVCTWMASNPPRELVEFCQAAYPDMQDFAGTVRIAEGAGLALYDSVTPSRSARWNDYYLPLRERLAVSAVERPMPPQEIVEVRARIDMFSRWGEYYRRVFYLFRPT